MHDLNKPLKRHKLLKWILKEDPAICCLPKKMFKYKDTDGFKEKKWRKAYHATTNQMKARVAILNSARADFGRRKLSG